MEGWRDGGMEITMLATQCCHEKGCHEAFAGTHIFLFRNLKMLDGHFEKSFCMPSMSRQIPATARCCPADASAQGVGHRRPSELPNLRQAVSISA